MGKTLASVGRELENLTKLRLRDLITDEEFLRQRQGLERERLRLSQSLEGLQKRDSWFEPARTLISFSKSAVSHFQAGDMRTKRLILTTVGSNLVLQERKLKIEAKKPFRRWAGTARYTALRAFVKDVRTFVSDPASLQVVTQIRQIVNPGGTPLNQEAT